MIPLAYQANMPPMTGAAIPFMPQSKMTLAKRNDTKINSWNIFQHMCNNITLNATGEI